MTPVLMMASMHSDADARALRKALAGVGGLVTCSDLGRRWHISKARAHELCNLPGFPEPVHKVGRSAVYIASECDRWYAHRWPNRDATPDA
jgi:predicted DNA-binding transcriptional regulator AlpA